MTQEIKFPVVTMITPNYEKKVFDVQFDYGELELSLQFKNILAWMMRNDEKLLEYAANHYTNKDLSQMVQDLYEIGVPVDTSVEQYFEEVQNSIAPQLLKFMEFLKNFGDNPQDSE